MLSTHPQPTLSTHPLNPRHPHTTNQPPPQVPQLALGMGERTRSGLTESPTTLDSPVRMKPTVSLPPSDSMGTKLHPVISPELGDTDTVLYGSPTKSTTNHQETDEAYFQKSTPKGNRRVVKRGTTSIERYADRNVTV